MTLCCHLVDSPRWYCNYRKLCCFTSRAFKVLLQFGKRKIYNLVFKIKTLEHLETIFPPFVFWQLKTNKNGLRSATLCCGTKDDASLHAYDSRPCFCTGVGSEGGGLHLKSWKLGFHWLQKVCQEVDGARHACNQKETCSSSNSKKSKQKTDKKKSNSYENAV